MTRWHHALGILSVAALLSGCNHLPTFGKSEPLPVATAEAPAVEMVCIWHPAQGAGLNGVPARGLAGQIMFFSAKNPSPLAVDGNVRIYLFDDQGSLEEQAKPIHIFDIPAEQWAAHLRSGSLGPGYQLFIPYPRGGHKQVTCTVQVRFTPSEGPVVYSPLSSVTLPGTVEDLEGGQENKQSTGSSRALPASFQTSSAETDDSSARPRMLVHSIRAQDYLSKPILGQPDRSAVESPQGSPAESHVCQPPTATRSLPTTQIWSPMAPGGEPNSSAAPATGGSAFSSAANTASTNSAAASQPGHAISWSLSAIQAAAPPATPDDMGDPADAFATSVTGARNSAVSGAPAETSNAEAEGLAETRKRFRLTPARR